MIPIFLGEDWNLPLTEERLMDQTREENSMCDIIMEGVSGQVTEVIEHILHHISDVGLHYTMSRREAEAKSARNIRRLQQQQRDWEERIDQALEMMPDRLLRLLITLSTKLIRNAAILVRNRISCSSPCPT